MRHFFLLFILIILTQCAASQTLEEQINEIRTHYNYVNDNLNNFESNSVETFEESTDGGTIKSYLDNGVTIKIRVEYFGETGKLYSEYYIKEERLIFVFDQNFQYNMPYYIDSLKAVEMGFDEWHNPEKTELLENRFYFKNEKIIRWIDDKGEQVDLMSPELIEKEKFYLDDFSKRRK